MASSELLWIFQILSRLPKLTHSCRNAIRVFFCMRLGDLFVDLLICFVLFMFSYFPPTNSSVVALVQTGRPMFEQRKAANFHKNISEKMTTADSQSRYGYGSLSQQLAISAAPLDTTQSCHHNVSKIFPRVRILLELVHEGRTL